MESDVIIVIALTLRDGFLHLLQNTLKIVEIVLICAMHAQFKHNQIKHCASFKNVGICQMLGV